jgi:hypothetical protein
MLREIDQLAHEIGSPERTLGTIHRHRGVAQRDDSIDVRDTGRSDQVFHAVGSNLAGFGDQGPSIGFDRGDTEAREPLTGGERWIAHDALEGAADRYCIQVAVR